MEGKTNAMRMLDNGGIPYITHTYDPEGELDGITAAKKLGADSFMVYKTLVTKSSVGRNFYIFVLPVDGELNLKKAAAAVGEKSVEMIHVRELNSVTGYYRGGCSPIGMKKNYRTTIHEDAMLLDNFYISAGRIGCQIEVNPEAVAGLIDATFADILH